MTTPALGKRSNSVNVKALQRMLHYLNRELQPVPPLATSGVDRLDDRAAALVTHFQRQTGLAATGRLDVATCWLLRQRFAERAASRVVPGHALPMLLGMAEDERFWFYIRCIACAGDDVREVWQALQAGRRVLLGLRVSTNTRSNNGGGAYDDRISVLWHKNGGHCREFEANTDPSSRYEDGYEHADTSKVTTNDADGDKRGDLGRLPYGIYRFKKDTAAHYGNILRPMDDLTGERDTGHDGWFSKKDHVSRRKALSAGKSILFHKGGKTITGSAACQTLRPQIFPHFYQSLGDQADFYYVLMASDGVWSRPLPRSKLPPPDLVHESDVT